MSRLKLIILVASISIVSAWATIAFAVDETAPATQPAVGPATAPVFVPVAADQSTPRGALKVLTQAMDLGDTAAAEGVLLSENAIQTNWAAAMLKLSSASVTARKASIQTFGEDGAKAIIGDASAASAYAMAAIDRSTEELQGDRATIRSEDGVEAPIEIRSVDAKWRVPVTVFVGDSTEEKLVETTDQMSRQADAIEAFCTEMTAGKYKSPEDAAQALQMAQVKAVFGAQAPATAPATQQAPG